MRKNSNLSTEKKEQASASQPLKVQNINYSTAEEHLLSELVVKHGKVLLDKTTNSNDQKKKAWQAIENEFNASSISKNLVSKFKNVKASLRKSYAANKLERQLTGGGKPPPDIEEKLSGAKQELHAAIALTIEGLAPNLDDDDDVHFAASGFAFTSETHRNGDESIIDRDLQLVHAERRTVLDLEFGHVTPEDLQILSENGVENTGAANSSDTQSAAVLTDSNENGRKQQWHDMRKNPMHALFRKKKTRKTNVGQVVTVNDGAECAANAKAAFYRSEEKRAAERHEMQMKLWRAEFEEKRAVHDAFLNEHRLRVELLTAQIGKEKRKRSRSDSRSCSSSRTYSTVTENEDNSVFVRR